MPGFGTGRDIFDSFFFQAEDGIRDDLVTGVQTCALPILRKLIMETRYNLLLAFILCAAVTLQAELPTKKVLTLGMAKKLVAAAEAEAKKRGARSEERRVGKECRCR